MLQDNLGDDLAVSSNGEFKFATALPSGAEYIVTVLTQPTSPSQTCTVASYSGTLANRDVTDVAVTCAANPYAVGGSVTGLTGAGLVLQDNGGDDLGITSNGAFTFATPVASGSAYWVSVKTQPSSPRQTCVVTNGAGTIGNGAVASVSVACANSYLLGGSLSGLTEIGLVLTSPGEPDLQVEAGATHFAFATPLTAGSSYAVSVKTQPAGQACTLQSASGTISAVDITTVAVQCVRVWSRPIGGGWHSAALTTGGTLWTWGTNGQGQLGDGTTTQRLSPVRVGPGFISVAASGSHTVAVKADGTLWAWGYNANGQLGDGTTTQRRMPIEVGSGFARVAAGYAHTAAVKTDETLWAWGYNAYGQLGDGTTTSRPAPVQVGDGFIAVAAGEYHTVAVKADSTLWAWGYNGNGQLGDGTWTSRLTPVRVGSGFISVAAGHAHTVAIKTNGTLWAWGNNGFGQLGDGTWTDRTTPVQVGSEFTAVAAGDEFTVAIKTDGTVWAWGYNGNGQLGDGTTTDRITPVQVGSGFTAVAAGRDHALAVKADGTLWAWGRNGDGELGDGTTTDRPIPVQIP